MRSSRKSRRSSITCAIRASASISAREYRAGCCSWVPPGPGRRCSRARSRVRPAYRSSRSAARNSSSSMSASGPRACVISSCRRSSTLRASSSSTRSTRSAAIARATAGFSGAELANLLNEAALLAAREDAQEVAWRHVEQALDKLTLGLERRTMRPSDAERRSAAYREAGHAIVSLCVPDQDPLRKISIVPRGGSLGAAAHLPTDERWSLSRRALESRLCVLLAGRMVSQYGFCEPVGPIRYVRSEEAPHAASSAAGASPLEFEPSLSRDTTATVDRQVRLLIERSHARAHAILESRRDALHALAVALLDLETLDDEQIRQVLRQDETLSSYDGHSSGRTGGRARHPNATALPSAALRRAYAAARRTRSTARSSLRPLLVGDPMSGAASSAGGCGSAISDH